jgi:hypothetical protein
LSLARERETVLAWDGQDGLLLFNRAGAIQAQRPSAVPVSAVCAADDGSAFAIGGSPGAVCWLAPDLAPRWQQSLPQRVTAIALEPLGRYVAVADAGCTLHLLDERGRVVWRATPPRPLAHLAFVPEKPVVIGAADFGLVVCFGSSGECLWRDGLVAHVGSLAVRGDGDGVLLACFGDGLYRYGATGPPQQRIPLDAPCSLAALSYTGDWLLTASRDRRASLREREGSLRDQFSFESAIVSLALGALGDYGVAGLADGAIHRLELTTSAMPLR